MAPENNFQPSSGAAGPSKSQDVSFCFAENATASIHEVVDVIRNFMNRKFEELDAKVENLIAKTNALEAMLNEVGKGKRMYTLQNCTVLDVPIDGNQSEREPVHHGWYELKITGNMDSRIHTGTKVQGQDSKPLKVVILKNGEKITKEPVASAEFEVVVLKGNFGNNQQDSWTSDEFQESVVKTRKEGVPILAHANRLVFSDGESVLDGLMFNDNSSWSADKNWQLGIRVLGSFNFRVKEAISNPFRVLDRHGKASEKPDTPNLGDGVGKLQRVGTKRALILEENNIKTVKDLLRRCHMNEPDVLRILSINSVKCASWKAMIEHAKKCETGTKLYSYRKKNSMLFFNRVFKVEGAEIKGKYIPFDELEPSKKELVNKWKKGFYKEMKIKRRKHDFEMQNGTPVPRYDQAAVLQNTRAADIIRVPDDAEPDIRRDADQNIASDGNTQNYYSIPDETANQVHGHEGSTINPNSTLEPNLTPVCETLMDSGNHVVMGDPYWSSWPNFRFSSPFGSNYF
ncbi:hypothetical protein LUZ63_013340 [Rhynchospora breviuscula]|uniref:Uncharacterized protein n=1 Tax=Rhynchospora breviuscula TaxID=2022672 RepID=A0A9Q0C8E1_9POAL|nr:hypothetical protein LUZ63_013340 [Rhynchospora breviuscula]